MSTETAVNRNPYAKLRETYANAGKSWSKVDDQELSKLFTAGNSIEDLSLLFGRTPNGVRQRLIRLNLLAEPQAAPASA